MTIEIIDDEKLEDAQKQLIFPVSQASQRGSEAQRAFIREVAEDPAAFRRRIRSWVTQKGDPPNSLPTRLSSSEFFNPPWKTELEIAKAWGNIPPNLASRPGTWVRIHLELMNKGIIDSHYLAFNNHRSSSGRDNIIHVLNKNDPDEIDQYVRRIFRHMGGLTGVRGKRTTYIDCPVAKAWWRNRFAQEAHRVFPTIEVKDYSEALRRDSGIWGTLIEAMVSRLTVTGDQNIRPGVVRYLAEKRKAAKQDINILLSRIGHRSTTQALGFLEPDIVFQIISNELVSANSKNWNS